MTIGLNRSFTELSDYQPDEYCLLPIRFLSLDSNRYIVSNIAGNYQVMERPDLEDLVRHRLPVHSSLYDDLKANHFLADRDSNVYRELLAAKYRTRQSRLPDFTSLHLFVVTLRCDHSCQYCQVSRVSEDRTAFDMSRETADRAIALMLESPSRQLKVEFQGGEPLLNFDLIRYIVSEVERLADGRAVQFVIASNLSPLTDEILEFAAAHKIFFSTSLDGPADLHNRNRPRPDNNSHARAVTGIERIRRRLGHDAVAALMTSTAESLKQPEAIIDEYVRLGFDSIFLRFISPYGFATKTAKRIGYETDEFIEFFKRGLAYIVSLNHRGIRIRETYSTLLLQRMLTPYATGYVDLQSPAGIGISVLAYNYDGGRVRRRRGPHARGDGRPNLSFGKRPRFLRRVVREQPLVVDDKRHDVGGLAWLLRLRPFAVLRERSGIPLSHARRRHRPSADERFLSAKHGDHAPFDQAVGR